MDWLDKSATVRSGEELAVDKLEAYLISRLPELDGPLTVRQFTRGFSNLTYLLRFGDQELVLRQPPIGARIETAHDMGREYQILSNLVLTYPKVPTPLLYCDDESVLGVHFYIMTRLKGIILRARMPKAMNPQPELMRRIADAFISNLVELHEVDYQEAGLADLGKPEGYVRRQIEGWTRRYHHARTEEIPAMEQAAGWLAENIPVESAAVLIHNDYKYDNIVLDPADWAQISGVLDWEMATIGDPLMDLGTTLGYWVQRDDPEEIQELQFSPTIIPGNPNREELVMRYEQLSGRRVDNVVFYYVYGLFKLAVIVQQIYARYKRGHTQDPRFANLILAVKACGRMAVRAVEKQRISGLI